METERETRVARCHPVSRRVSSGGGLAGVVRKRVMGEKRRRPRPAGGGVPMYGAASEARASDDGLREEERDGEEDEEEDGVEDGGLARAARGRLCAGRGGESTGRECPVTGSGTTGRKAGWTGMARTTEMTGMGRRW